MFQPDYRNLVNAARNEKTERIPLYEHNISPGIMERMTGKKFAGLLAGSHADKVRFFREYCDFQKRMGYDAVTFEGTVIDVMPGNGCLTGRNRHGLSTKEEFEAYPWDKIEELYFARYADEFSALREAMPEGMKAVGGVGNGVFEIVQDIVGFENLCYIKADDEGLFCGLFQQAGDLLFRIWKRFLGEFGDIYCICRTGDDLGFKSATLLPGQDIRELIIPQYRRVIRLVHSSAQKQPFLLHSCGCIFSVMDDLIAAGIDAKHSNEDQIAPFSRWIELYGDRIGNFGGLDTDCLCDSNPCSIADYTARVYRQCAAKGKGAAIGSGNSIPDYVSPQRYLTAVNTIRRMRGDDPGDFLTM